MAGTLNSIRENIIKESKILVKVDHASEELLVVSYPFKNKLFQGILIDSTNRYLPCAYPKPEVVKWSPPRVIDPKDPSSSEELQQSPDINRPFYSLSNRFTYFQDVLFQKNIALVKSAKQAKAKAQKMTVRLRPRQVLCSKCRSICNENSENVHSSSSKKEAKSDNSKKLLTESSDNENQNIDVKSPRKKVTTLVPKLSRLEGEDIRSLNGGQSEVSRVWSEMLEADKQMVLRKKRSVGSMEDLWDETVFEEAAKKAKTTPIIKISFGSPGEGTVVKIPAKVRLTASEGEDEAEKDTIENSKAFKKALKKAKKEAKRKISPEREEAPLPEEPNYKKHRHRVKHKKKHKNSKEEALMKDKCLKQKLSINLRRVCSGPGEEESWSGESSRSSEMIKDSEETKSELSLMPNISSREGGNNSHDCKQILRFQTTIDSIESSKRSTKIRAQKKRKLEDLVSERLASGALKQDVISVISTDVLPEFTNPITSSSSVSVNQQYGDITSFSRGIDHSSRKVKIEEMSHVGCCSDSEVLDQKQQYGPSEQNQLLIMPSDKSFSVPDSSHLMEKGCLRPTAVESRVPIVLEETLDDAQVSEDSLLDMEDTVEDSLLVSDKEAPMNSCSNALLLSVGISNPEINSDIKSLKTESTLADHNLGIKSEDKLCRSLSPENTHIGGYDHTLMNISGVTGSKSICNEGSVIGERLFNQTRVQLLESSHIEKHFSVSADPLDSSEESEFLPAEDNLDYPVASNISKYPQHERDLLSPAEIVETSSVEVSSNKDPRDIDCTSPTLSNLGCPVLEAAQSCTSPTEFTDAMLESRSDLSPPPLEKYQDEPVQTSKRGYPISRDSTTIPSDSASHYLLPPQLGCESENLKVPNYLETDPLRLKEDLPSSDSDNDSKSEEFDHSDANDSFEGSGIPAFHSDSIQEKMDVCLEKPSSLMPLDSSDSVPDFPPSSPLVSHQDVTSCRTVDGSILSVGDIVWAKIQDFPWWPAKVVRLCANIGGNGRYDARVAWFGSATSTLMSADQLSPFIQTFQAKYNRERKSSGYLAAIRQATTEASSRDYHLPQPLAEINKLLTL